MKQIYPITFARHGQRRRRGYTNFIFAASTSTAPLAAAEVAQAALSFPLAFIQREGHWGLAVVLGLSAGQNLYVSESGSWLARYVPAFFRGYPFLIGAQRDGEAMLCIDEASGLLTDEANGESLFDKSGALSPSILKIANFLTETARSEAALMQASELLVRAGVIESWPVATQGEQDMRQITGLYRVNEAALNGLDDEIYNNLRRSGVVAVAYAQLLSMGNLTQLNELAQARAQANAQSQAEPARASLINLPDDSTIDWDWSKIGR